SLAIDSAFFSCSVTNYNTLAGQTVADHCRRSFTVKSIPRLSYPDTFWQAIPHYRFK
ncbi:hypothetical protein ODD70_004939, partial [Salmonella enterica]|nr:hypothetical protein [Salmonella enterica]